jgi:hypothetical protein
LPTSAIGFSAEAMMARPLQLAHAGLGLDRLPPGQRRGVERAGHHVLGQLEVRRARLLGLGHLERLADDLRYDLRAGYARVPLDDGAQDADQVDVLMRLLVHALEVRLARQGKERCAVQKRVGNRGDEVGCPGAEGPEAHARPSGQAADSVGHVGTSLLMADGHELNRGLRQRFA